MARAKGIRLHPKVGNLGELTKAQKAALEYEYAASQGKAPSPRTTPAEGAKWARRYKPKGGRPKKSQQRPVPEAEREEFLLTQKQRKVRGKRKPKGKTRSIAAVGERIRRRRIPPAEELCRDGGRPECRFCAQGIPLRIKVGRKYITEPSIIDGWRVVRLRGGKAKEALKIAGKSRELFPARYKTREEAMADVETRVDACVAGVEAGVIPATSSRQIAWARHKSEEALAESVAPARKKAKPKAKARRKTAGKKAAPKKKRPATKKKRKATAKKKRSTLKGLFWGTDGPVRWGTSRL